MKILYPHLKPIRLIFSLLVSFLLTFPLIGQYCTPGDGFNNCNAFYRIENITFSTINNNSTCEPDDYQDFTGSVPAPLIIPGQDYTLSYVIGTDVNVNEFAVWIDFNNDEDFEDVGEEVYYIDGVPDVGSATISIPSSVSGGVTRMRVQLVYNDNPVPCPIPGDYTYVETEDYLLDICPAGVGASFSGLDPLVCDGRSEVISVSRGAEGDETIDWEISSTGVDGSWVSTGDNDINDNHSTGAITQSTFYRAIIHSNTYNCDAPTLPVFKIYNGADALPENSSICPNDSVSLTSTASPATSILRNETNVLIPDNGTGVSTININNSLDPIFASTKIKEVCYTVSHQYPGDIANVILRSPSGTNFNFNNNDIVGSFCFDNVQKPGLINTFLGENINGNWQFRISDDFGAGDGLIEEWSIEFETGVKWQSVVGNASDISSPHEFTTKVSNPTFGNKSYTASPVVFDVSCFTPDTVEVFMNGDRVNAGGDQIVCNDDNKASLAGTPINANNTGSLIWTKKSGPGTAVFSAPNNENTDVTVSDKGVYVFLLTHTLSSPMFCVVEDSVTIEFPDLIAPISNDKDSVCLGGDSILLSTTEFIPSRSWSSGDVNMFLSNASPVTSIINVDSIPYNSIRANSIESVCLNVNHSWVSDVRIRLRAPNGTTQALFNRTGGTGDNFDNVCFVTDPSAPTISSQNGNGTPAYSGNYRALNGVDLNQPFNGIDPNGNWELLLDDDSGPDNGALVNWSITFNTHLDWTSLDADGSEMSLNVGDQIKVLPNNVGKFRYQVTASTPGVLCEEVEEIEITVVDPNFNAGTDSDTCGYEFQLNADDLTAGSIGTWTNGNGNPVAATFANDDDPKSTVTVTQEGVYNFAWTVKMGDCIKYDTVQVTFTTRPVAPEVADQRICDLSTTQLHAPVVGVDTNYHWFREADNPKYQITDTLNVTVTGFAKTYYLKTEYNGCFSLDSTDVEVDYYEKPIISSTVTNLSCNGDVSGEIDVHANLAKANEDTTWVWTGDNGDYTGVNSLGSRTGLNAGFDTVVVTDGNGCMDTAFFEITEPIAISFTANVRQNITCNGDDDGIIEMSYSGGTSNYRIGVFQSPTVGDSILNLAAGDSAIKNLSPGTYTAFVRDANGCYEEVTGLIIIEPAPFEIDTIWSSLYPHLIGTNVSCKGGNDDSTVIHLKGGTRPYNYKVLSPSINQADSIFYALGAGTYDFQFIDNNGCLKDTANITLTEPSNALASTSTQDSVKCFNGNDGKIIIAPIGGTAGYEYRLIAGPGSPTAFQKNDTISNLVAGSYTYEVRDTNGCTVTGTQEVFQPDTFQIIDLNLKDYNGFQISCKDSADGEISIHAIGASRKYSYSTTAPAATAINDSTFSIINAGSHTFTVTDYHGCTVDTIVDFNEPSEFMSDAFQESGLCAGDANAKVNLVAISDVSGYVYSIDTKADKIDANDTTVFSGFNAGTYNYSIKDDNGCIAEGSINVTEPTPLQIDSVSLSDYYGFNVSCNDSTDGKVELFPKGGTAPYTYTVNSGAFVSDSSFETLAATSYTFTVKDNNNCEVDSVITLTEPSPITANAVQDSVSCNGLADGQVTLSVTSDIIGYDYNLDGDIVNEQNDSYTYSGLLAGSYNYSVTDSNGCIATGMVEVLEPEAIFFSGTSLSEFIGGNNISCKDSATGSITTQVRGGTKPYIYSLSGNNNFGDQASNLFNNLVATAGDVLTVKDANGCISDTTIVLTEPSLLTSNSIVDSVNCFGENSGEVQLSGAGSVPGYSFTLLDNPHRNNKSGYFDGLVAKAYNYEVTDTNGCVIEASFEVKEPDTLDITDALLKQYIGGNNVSCFGASDGEVTFSVIGGTKPYNYTQLVPFGGSSNSPLISGLSAGSYTFRVTDRNNCLADTGLVFTQPQKLTASAVSTPANCFGESNGTITITAQGGIAAYTYEIIAGPQTRVSQASNVFNGLPSGTYTYKVVDQNGCDFQADVTVNQPDELLIDNVLLDEYIGGKNVSCFGLSDASLEVFASGGNGGYQYQLSGANNSILQNNNKFNNLRAGITTIRVVDAKSCETTFDTLISEPDQLVLNYTQDSVSCYGLSDGSVNLNLVGGNKDYLQVFEQAGVVLKSNLNNAASMTVSDLSEGSYIYKVTDANGCAESKDVFIFEPDSFKIVSATVIPPSCFGFTDDSTSFVLTGGTEVYTYTNNETGVTQKGNGLFTQVGPGTYHYTFTDYNGCTADTTVSIIMPNPLVASATMDSVTCFGKDIGAIYTSANGGNKPYEFSLAGPMNRSPQDDSTFLNLSAGDYQFIVQDSTGCIFTDDIEVTSARQIKLSFTEADTLVCDGGTGFAKFKFMADPDDYEYGINGFVTQKLNANEREFEYLDLEQDGHSVFVQNTDKTCGASIDFVVRKDIVTAGNSFYYNTQFNDDKICKGSPYTVKLINSRGGISWEESFDEGATWEVVTGKKSSKFQLTNIQESRWLRAKLSGVVIEECVEYSQIAKFNVSKSSISKLEVLLEGNDDFSQNICTNSEYDLTVSSEDGVNNGGSFTWFSSENSNQGIDQNASLNSDSILFYTEEVLSNRYYVEYTDEWMCYALDSIDINTDDALGTEYIEGPNKICLNDSIVLKVRDIKADIQWQEFNANSQTWEDIALATSLELSVKVDTVKSFRIKGSSPNGVCNYFSEVFEIAPYSEMLPQVDLTVDGISVNDTAICAGTAINVIADASGGKGNLNYFFGGSAIEYTSSPLINVREFTTNEVENNLMLNVKVKDENGCESTDSILINNLEIPVQGVLSANDNLCNGDTGLIWIHDYNSESIQWQRFNSQLKAWENLDNGTLDTISVSEINNTKYRVLQITGVCSLYTAEFDYHVLPFGNFDFDLSFDNQFIDSASICVGGLGLIELSDFESNGGNQFTWNTVANIENSQNSNQFNFIADSVGTFQNVLVVTDQFGCNGSDTLVVIVDSKVEVGEISSDHFIACGGEEYTLSVSDVVGEIEWQKFDEFSQSWVSANETGSALTNTSDNSYTKFRVKVTNGACKVLSKPFSQNISANEKPAVRIEYLDEDAGDTLVVCNLQELELGSKVNSTMPTVNTWNSNSLIILSGSNKEKVKVKAGADSDQALVLITQDFDGCIGVDTLIIKSIDNDFAGDIVSQDVIACEGEEVILTQNNPVGTSVLYKLPDVKITSSVSGEFNYNPTREDTLLYLVNTLGACSDTSSFYVLQLKDIIDSIEIISANGLVICEDAPSLLSTNKESGELVWSTGETTDEISVRDLEQVSVVYTDPNACGVSYDTISLFLAKNVNPYLVWDQKPLATVCGNDFVKVSVEAEVDISSLERSWNGISQQNTFDYEVKGEEDVFVIIKLGSCEIYSDTVDFIASDYPDLPSINSSTGGAVVCEGDSVELNVLDVGFAFWNNDETDTINPVVTKDTTLFAYVKNEAGCITKSEAFKVDFFPRPEKPTIFSPTGTFNFCDGDVLNLYHDAKVGYWMDNPRLGKTTFGVDSTSVVTVTAINSFGCKHRSDKYSVVLRENPKQPVISSKTGKYEFCDGDTLELLAENHEDEYIAWMGDSLNNTIDFSVTEDLAVYLRYYDSTGTCFSETDQVIVYKRANPEKPTISIQNEFIETQASGDEIRWFNLNIGLLDNDNQVQLQPFSSGDYYVRYINDYECYSNSDTVNYTYLSINNLSNSNLSVYPNPVSVNGNIMIDGVKLNKDQPVVLTDASGKRIILSKVNQNTFRIENVAKAVYTLTCFDANNRKYITRLIVE